MSSHAAECACRTGLMRCSMQLSLSDSNVSDSAESDTQNTFSELRRPIQQNRTHMHKSDDEHDYRRASAGCERR